MERGLHIVRGFGSRNLTRVLSALPLVQGRRTPPTALRCSNRITGSRERVATKPKQANDQSTPSLTRRPPDAILRMGVQAKIAWASTGHPLALKVEQVAGVVAVQSERVASFGYGDAR